MGKAKVTHLASSLQSPKALSRLSLIFLSLIFLLLSSAAYGAGPGSLVPATSLKNLAGESVELAVSRSDVALILYFFEPSSETLSMFRRLDEMVSSTNGLSMLGIIPRDIAEVGDCPRELQAKLLHDDPKLAGIFSNKTPFLAVIGPGNILLATLDEASDVEVISTDLSDVFLANGFGAIAQSLCQFSVDLGKDAWRRTLLLNYASVLDGEVESAREGFSQLLQSQPERGELHAAMGFLLFRMGESRRALDECKKASGVGSAEWVSGLILSRAGDCERARHSFEKSATGKFLFRWQRVLALVSAGSSADSKDDSDKALPLYKKAFELAPLNRTVLANLLFHYWGRDKLANAEAYAAMLRDCDLDPLTRSLLGEYESEREYKDSPSAGERLEKIIKTGKTEAKTGQSYPEGVLVSDFHVVGCPVELAGIDVAAAGYLKTLLGRGPRFTVIPRSEMLETARVLNTPRDKLHEPSHLQRIAQALSCKFLILPEIGVYEDTYLMNIRIANAHSGEIIAVSTQRFPTYKDAGPAIDRAAAELAQSLSMK